jgi:hypothetical protein
VALTEAALTEAGLTEAALAEAGLIVRDISDQPLSGW